MSTDPIPSTTEIDDGGPAFGQVVDLRCVRVEMDGATEWEPETSVPGGLTIRDYLAASLAPAIYADFQRDGTAVKFAEWRQGVAVEAYRIADEMLAERAKR